MRVVVPQITWHSRQPILSVDFDPTSKGDEGFYRVATGGGDCQLLVWRLASADTLKPEFTCVAELKRHEKPLNVVRFSPDGSLIGSGGDDAYLILWKCLEKNEKQENWQFEKSLRKHIEDVSDLSWSPDGLFLLSASIDNSAVLWDVKKGTSLHVWNEKEHSGFVHGVAYDPLHEFAATMCIDRNLRFFDLKTKKTAHKAFKYPGDWISAELQAEMDSEEKENHSKLSTSVDDVEQVEDQDALPAKKKAPKYINRLFHDEFLPTFCRRMSFSPRGELLLVPGGLLPPGQNSSGAQNLKENAEVGDEGGDKMKGSKEKKSKKKTSHSNNNATVVFCRHSWINPCAVIPTLDSYSIATRFCPVYFKRNRQPYTYDQSIVHPKKNERSFASINKIASPKEETHPLMQAPYRLVYAVATNDTVIIGDTASSTPLAVVRSIHLARITDVTWAADGLALMVSSTDNYCSLITFGKGELGEEFCVETFPTLTRDCFPILPSEPKPEKPKRKSAKPVKEKEAKGEAKPKTPTSAKKEPAQSKNIRAMFSALAAASSAEPKPNDSEQAPSKIYPMTPPKPIAIRRISTTTVSPSPLSVQSFSSPSGSQQNREQGDVTPEELHRLTTVPIKCRRIMEQDQPTPIMESSNYPKSVNGTVTPLHKNSGENGPVIVQQPPETVVAAPSSVTPYQNVSELEALTSASPNVTDPNCPPSPVSSSTSTARAPRRITLLSLPPAVENNAGKLD